MPISRGPNREKVRARSGQTPQQAMDESRARAQERAQEEADEVDYMEVERADEGEYLSVEQARQKKSREAHKIRQFRNTKEKHHFIVRDSSTPRYEVLVFLHPDETRVLTLKYKNDEGGLGGFFGDRFYRANTEEELLRQVFLVHYSQMYTDVSKMEFKNVTDTDPVSGGSRKSKRSKKKNTSRKASRKAARKSSRKPSRKPSRKASKKSSRKASRKPTKKSKKKKPSRN